MNRLMVRIHLLALILLSIFGNSFLKFKLIIPSFFLITYFLFCTLHVLLYFLQKKISITKNEQKLIKFIFFMIISILLSLLGFYKFFDLNGIYFDSKYILKQVMFLDLLPIGLSVYICFINQSKMIEELLKKYSQKFFILFCILSIVGLCKNTVSYYTLLLLSFIELNKENRRLFYKLIIFLITAIYIKNIFSESTAFLMLLIYMIVLIFNKNFFDFLYKKRKIIYVLIVILLLIAVVNKDLIISYLQIKDPNYWWRFSYWMTELETLKDTYFLGVGFGSTYASTSIFEVLSGGFIDPETGVFVNSVKVLFTTAQHNSYMNILYRTGLIGIILFVRLVFSLIFKYKKYLRTNYDKMLYLAFLNANIIITFNVGLESPQFLIPFYFSLFGLMSLEKKYKINDKGVI